MITTFKSIIVEMLGYIAWNIGRSRPHVSAKDQLTIVTFHRVLPETLREQYPYPGLAVTPEELDWFCQYFNEHYDCGSVTQQWERLRNNEVANKPLLAMSFDDGQLDNYEYAHAVLKENNLVATFYIPTRAVNDASIIWHDRLGYAIRALQKAGALGVIGELGNNYNLSFPSNTDVLPQWVESIKLWHPERRQTFINDTIEKVDPDAIPEWGRLMSWDEIRSLQSHGHEIGSHSVNHYLMDQLDLTDLQYEIEMSAQSLETELGQAMSSFCYPNGNWDVRCPKILEQTGYTNATTTQWGLNSKSHNPYCLMRCDISAPRFRNHRHKLSRTRTALRLAGLQPGLHMH